MDSPTNRHAWPSTQFKVYWPLLRRLEFNPCASLKKRNPFFDSMKTKLADGFESCARHLSVSLLICRNRTTTTNLDELYKRQSANKHSYATTG